MKKRALLFIPIILSVIPLTSCKDYKYDNPKAVFRNSDTSVTGVRLKCPYQSNANRLLETNYINDIENVVIKTLNKATFKVGYSVTDSPNECLEFTCNSYVQTNTMGNAHFKVYDNGYLIYEYQYVEDLESLNLKKETFRFTFDASIAKTLFEKVNAEFDKSKVEEDRILSTLTIDNFFKTLEKQKREVILYETDGRKKGEYYDNGDVLKELKTLDYTLIEDSSFVATSYKYPVSLTNARTEKDGSYFKYEGGVASWSLSINADGESCRMDYTGRDKYNKSYRKEIYYSLNPEQALPAIEKIFTISDNLKNSTNL